MLQEGLQPILQQIQGRNWEEGLRITREWFASHPENIVSNESELPYLCELPGELRHLVTYPVIGNLVLSRLSGFQPRSDYQRTLLEMARRIVEETRFHNYHHTREVKPMSLIQLETELTAMMLERPDEAREFQEYITDVIANPISDTIESLQAIPDRTYIVDFGHGLAAPLADFTYDIVFDFGLQMEYGATGPLDKVSMVVDDTKPEYWHDLLKLAGFQERDGQLGYFSNGESALPALEAGDYDIILTDLELGEGRMNGIEFARRARQVQLAKGKPAMIALFSYNYNALEAAESFGFHYPSEPDHLFFEQPRTMNKGHFFPFSFRWHTEYVYRNMR